MKTLCEYLTIQENDSKRKKTERKLARKILGLLNNNKIICYSFFTTSLDRVDEFSALDYRGIEHNFFEFVSPLGKKNSLPVIVLRHLRDLGVIAYNNPGDSDFAFNSYTNHCFYLPSELKISNFRIDKFNPSYKERWELSLLLENV